MTVIGRKQQPLSCLHGTTAGTRASFCPGHTRPVFPGASATKKQREVLVSAFEDTEKFLGEVARVSCPAGLEAFMQVLEVEGAEGLAPTATAGLHPHFVPVAQLPAAAGEGGAASEPCIGLLCWGDGKPHAGMELPVVQMTRGSTSMALLACSVEEYVHRRLAEEDAANGPGAIAAAAGQMGQQLYQAGAVQGERLSRLDAYLVRCVGAFPDVSEDLCEAHLAKGDEMSALITAEWYMKNKVLSGAWARAMEYASALYVAVGRGEEARDTARLALRSPWWTLRDGYSACRKRAQVEGTAEEVMQLLAGKSEEQQQQKRSLGVELPPKAQTAEDRALRQAALLMNKVVAGEISGWDEIRQDLAAVYNEADLPAALLVVAPSQ